MVGPEISSGEVESFSLLNPRASLRLLASSMVSSCDAPERG